MRTEKKNNTTAEKPTKWQYLAERVVKQRGRRRRYNIDELKAEFKAYVDYYTHNGTAYTRKSRQKKGGSGDEVQAERVERTSPMNEWSFCVWLGYDGSWMTTTILDIEDKEKPTEEDLEYVDFLKRVKTFLRSHLLEGAIVSEYNYNVVAAVLGLKKNVDVTSGDKALDAPIINLVPDNMTREQYQANVGSVGAMEITEDE